MSYRQIIFAVFGIGFLGPIQAAQLSFTFDMSLGMFSANCQMLEDVTGQTPQVLQNGFCYVDDGGAYGTLTYDNAGAFAGDNGLGASLYDATVELTATLVSAGSDLGTAGGENGTTVVNDDPGGDFVNVAMSGLGDNWSGFSVGDYDFVGVGAVFLGSDFLDDESLPGILPPPGYERAFLNFSVVDINNPSVVEGLGVSVLALTPVPVPAAVWLLGSALGVLGWMKRSPA